MAVKIVKINAFKIINVIKYFARSSKLIIIYILTVIVSGSILTYLSINNISNFEELTEKRITEEEKTFIENYRLQFQGTLENLVKALEKSIQSDSLTSIEKDLQLENELINDYLIMNKNGALIKPHFVQNTFRSNKSNTSLSFSQKFQLAENYEFVQKDYKNAEKQYLSTLKFTTSKSDSAKIYNAVARLHVKTGDQKQALELYKQIITRLSFTVNDFGIPYAYFSLDQLLKLTDKSLKKEREEVLITFLNGLLNNNIPYNNSTTDLIVSIQNKIAQIENKETQELVQSLCFSINEKIATIFDYNESMRAIIKDEQTEPSLRLKNFFVIVNENSNDEIMLLQQSDEESIGFTVLLENLDSLVLENIKLIQSKFEYDIQIVNTGLNGSFFEKELIIQNNFSPFFRDKLIQVKLKNPNTVGEYVFKRKIATAIGLFLLLAAMLIGLFTLIQYVNRNKHMERLRADFVSNVTHELKTPLTSINMFAESILLGRVKSEKDLKKYSNIIVKESERLKRMINNILDFSRKENDKLTYHLKEYDLLDIVNSTMKEMDYWLEINKFELSLELQSVKAIVDPEGIKQVLANLISNAIKYSDTKKKLVVRLYKKGKQAFIEIEDQGIGIPEEKHKSIFEKFYRVNSKKNENISGTGLGLTVSKDIIEAQNGKLLVSSTLNKGSKFTIVLNI